MQTIYRTTVIDLGDGVEEFLEGKMMIIFKEGAPPELAELSVIHSPEKLDGEIAAGQFLKIGDEEYEIYGVGEVVNKNIRKLGHSCIKFNGSREVELPGDINVEDKETPELKEGISIEIFSK